MIGEKRGSTKGLRLSNTYARVNFMDETYPMRLSCVQDLIPQVHVMRARAAHAEEGRDRVTTGRRDAACDVALLERCVRIGDAVVGRQKDGHGAALERALNCTNDGARETAQSQETAHVRQDAKGD